MINLIFDKFDKKLDKAISNSISVEQYNSLNSKDTSVHRIWNDYRFLMQALKLSDVSYNFISTENYYNNFSKYDHKNAFYITEPHISIFNSDGISGGTCDNYWYHLSLIGDEVKTLVREKLLKIVFIFAIEPWIVFNHSGNLTTDESPWSTSSHSFNLIYNFANKWDLPVSQLCFVSGNFYINNVFDEWFSKQKYSEKITVVPFEIFKYSILWRNRGYVQSFCSNTIRKKHYVCLNNWMKAHRLRVINFLDKNNYLDKGLVSCIKPYTYTQISLTNYLSQSVINKLPLVVDNPDNSWVNAHHNNFSDIYRDSYFSIVNETSFDDYNIYFLSEKPFKPILNLHPFIIVGAAYSLRRLRELGFRTFDGYIDESYDEMQITDDRWEAIQKEISKLCDMKIKHLHKWYMSMQEILLYNQQHMLNNFDDLNVLFSKLRG